MPTINRQSQYCSLDPVAVAGQSGNVFSQGIERTFHFVILMDLLDGLLSHCILLYKYYQTPVQCTTFIEGFGRFAYAGQSSYLKVFPPTFITVSENDPIANIAVVDKRVENLRNAGVEVEYRRYRTAGHGFGLGTGTDAEGWLDHAVRSWEKHLSKGAK